MPHSVSRHELYNDLFIAYHKAIVHKSDKRCVQECEKRLDTIIHQLTDELYERRYHSRPSSCFIVKHPKKREVFAADFIDRIIHHYIFMKTHILFERTFIHDTYSCIEKRGTHYGIQRLRHHIESCSENYTRPCYVLKMDLKGYFMHIDRLLLSNIVDKTLDHMAIRPSDGAGLMWEEKIDIGFMKYLCREVIMSDPTEGCIIHGDRSDWDGLPDSKCMFLVPKGYGLPIGNLTSQLFSNVFLNQLDQFVKRTLRCKHYGRYVDDYFLVSTDRHELHRWAKEIEKYLSDELHISINKGKTQVCDAMHGVEFLGAYIKPWRIYISNQSLRRMHRQIPSMMNKTPEQQMQSVNSFLGILGHYNSYRERKKLVQQVDITRIGYMTDGDYRKIWRWEE